MVSEIERSHEVDRLFGLSQNRVSISCENSIGPIGQADHFVNLICESNQADDEIH